MKLSASVLKTLLMTASIGMVVPLIAQKTPPAKPKTEAKPETEVEPVLPGVPIVHGEGWMALSLEKGTFRLGFYDTKKKPVPANVARANARWDNPLKTGELRAVLNPSSDGMALTGNKPVRGPYIFKVYLTLLDADGNAMSTHVVDFKP